MDAGSLLIRLPWTEIAAGAAAVGCGLYVGADWGRGWRVVVPVLGLWLIVPLPMAVLYRALAAQGVALADRPLAAWLAVAAGALFAVGAVAAAYATERPSRRAEREARDAEKRRAAEAARAEARRQQELRRQAEARQAAARAEYVRFCSDRQDNGPWDAATADYCAAFVEEQEAQRRKQISGYQWYAMTNGTYPFENYQGWLRRK